MDSSYWQRQTTEKPLFPDIEWNKPEQRSRAGKLGVIGGNKLGFAAAAEAYSTALQTGAGEVRVLLPDVLKKNIPTTMTDVQFVATNLSGSVSVEALPDLIALGDWADALLFIGDAGKNSQTASLYERFMAHYDKPMILTRDAIDLLQNSMSILLDKPHITLIASFAQVQKIFRGVYYPKILTFSMQLAQLVDNLHKFTITYPVTIVTFHTDQLIIAYNGQVVTHPWTNPMAIWRGTVAAQAAAYLLWTPLKPLESIAASLI